MCVVFRQGWGSGWNIFTFWIHVHPAVSDGQQGFVGTNPFTGVENRRTC